MVASRTERGVPRGFFNPRGVATDSAGNVYVADALNNTIRRVTPAGMVTTTDGAAGFVGSANGTGTGARFNFPSGVAVDGDGNVYVADFYYNTIRKGFPAPMILNSRFNVGQFSFDLTGPVGYSVVVEASTDLVNWLPIWTNIFGAGALDFGDPQSGISSNRFYRTHLP